MEEEVIKVIWTEEAESHLKSVYHFHSEYSEEQAFTLITNIQKKANAIIFPKQYQVDEYHPKYRRMIFGDYKILFKSKKRVVSIMAIFPSKNNPVKLSKL